MARCEHMTELAQDLKAQRDVALADLAQAQSRADALAIENAELRAAANAMAERGHAILAISPWNAARLCFLCYQASHTYDCPCELFRVALEAYGRLRGGRVPEGD